MINMKRAFMFSIMMLLLIFINATIVAATEPSPRPVAYTTTISSIIPLNENNLELTSKKININFLESDIIPVYKNIERQAKVTMTYEFYNPGDSFNVNFTLPFISKFLYFPNEFKIKLNDNSIDSKLFFSNYFYMYNHFRLYYENNNFSDYLNEFQKEKYDEIMIKNYQFKNDVDGYLYTLVNPKTKSEKFKANTEITFYNVPSNTKFIDHNFNLFEENSNITTIGRLYSSEQVEYFFVTEDLETECISSEMEVSGNGSIGHGIILEPAKIYIEPIKLSDYIKRFYIADYDLAYASEFENYFHKKIDENFNRYSSIDLGLIYNATISEYQYFGLEFNIDFPAMSKTIIEISYDIPIICKFNNYDSDSQMVLEFVENPGELWNDLPQTEVMIITDEKIVESSIAYEHNQNIYKLILNSGKDIERITLTNSLYVTTESSNGCRFLSISDIMYFGLIFITLYFFRRNKKIF